MDSTESGNAEQAEQAKPAAVEKEELQAEIERTREDLARTVDQLTDKLDVKGRVSDRAAEVKDDAVHKLQVARDRATDEQGKPEPVALGVAAGAAAVVTFVVVALVRRRRARRRLL